MTRAGPNPSAAPPPSATATARALAPVLALFAALLLGLLPAAAGCARLRDRLNAAEVPDEPARIIAPDRAGVTPAEVGLEVVVWTADDTYYRVGRALHALAVPEPSMPEPDRLAWERAGLRILAVPADRLDELLAKAPPLTSVQRQRFAQLPRWTPLVRGPALPPGVPSPDARTNAGTIPPGHPRLIARSWIEPAITDDGPARRLRTELAIQMERARRQALLADPADRTIADAGEIFESLLTAIHADGPTATVIVAEHPGTDWSELPEPPPPPAPADPAAGPQNQSGPAGVIPADPTPGDAGDPGADARSQPGTRPAPTPPGPVEPAVRTLGERMLAAPGVPAREGRPPVGPRKVILVLIPRLQTQDATETPRDGEP